MPEKILEKFHTEVELPPREILARFHRMANHHNYNINQTQLRYEAFSGQISPRFAKNKDDLCAKFIISEIEDGLSEIKGEVILKTNSYLAIIALFIIALPCACCIPILVSDFQHFNESLAVLPDIYFTILGLPCLTILVAMSIGVLIPVSWQKKLIADIFEAIDEMPKAKHGEKKKRG